ncbi:hypothetical protein G6F24_014919 [Rhizopus arrhizus]|nr:hypothetical protein G6F24_014919 [Rhizopus arrhizus]
METGRWTFRRFRAPTEISRKRRWEVIGHRARVARPSPHLRHWMYGTTSIPRRPCSHPIPIGKECGCHCLAAAVKRFLPAAEMRASPSHNSACPPRGIPRADGSSPASVPSRAASRAKASWGMRRTEPSTTSTGWWRATTTRLSCSPTPPSPIRRCSGRWSSSIRRRSSTDSATGSAMSGAAGAWIASSPATGAASA